MPIADNIILRVPMCGSRRIIFDKFGLRAPRGDQTVEDPIGTGGMPMTADGGNQDIADPSEELLIYGNIRASLTLLAALLRRCGSSMARAEKTRPVPGR
jgi:hypothetical protein